MLGSAGLQQYITKYEVKLEKSLAALITPHQWEKKPFEHFVTEQNAHLCPPEAIDLLARILVYDHAARLTCVEAMQHRYFDPVRQSAKWSGASAVPSAAKAPLTSGKEYVEWERWLLPILFSSLVLITMWLQQYIFKIIFGKYTSVVIDWAESS